MKLEEFIYDCVAAGNSQSACFDLAMDRTTGPVSPIRRPTASRGKMSYRHALAEDTDTTGTPTGTSTHSGSIRIAGIIAVVLLLVYLVTLKK